jgi:hypothetical protein
MLTTFSDSKIYDVIIMDGSGAVICEFNNLVVQKLSVHPTTIHHRLDLVFQPISLPTAGSNPQATYSTREHQHDEEALFKILDSLALKMISNSLQQSITVDADVRFR